jgi:hypothetical protein
VSIAAATASIALALTTATAAATFHLVYVREVYPGSTAAPEAAYVELQAYASGQNHVQGHTISLYSASGALTGKATFGSDVSGEANQSTVLAATPAAESQFGVLADTGMPAGSLDPAGGAVCWEALDCVSWGGFHGSIPSAAGSPADPLGIPDGMALRRTIEPGCPTLLEPSDDRDNSAVDFLDAFPAPRPNSVLPTERACAPEGSGPGGPQGPRTGGAGRSARRPQTTIRDRPARVTHRRAATFAFDSSLPGSSFLCKLDRRPFKPCRSPFTARRLRPGRHVFRVKARAPGGSTDRSPAAWRFRVLAGGR